MKEGPLKRKLLNVWDSVHYIQKRILLLTRYRLSIMSTQQSIDFIINNHCAISRFGDGELQLMLDKDSSIGFQDSNSLLSQRLRDIFCEPPPNLLICMPRYMNTTRGCTPVCKKYWRDWGVYGDLHQRTVKFVRSKVGKNYCFGNALLTRPYIDQLNPTKAQKTFDSLKRIWEGRDLLIIEGNKTRLGIGNDLFSNAQSIKRILAPATNAFDVYDKITQTAIALHTGELVLIALGPTATVLASDLAAHNIQALDIGHIDIEYEWFLQRATSKTAIEGKFTNESRSNQQVVDCTDKIYLSQIIAEVK